MRYSKQRVEPAGNRSLTIEQRLATKYGLRQVGVSLATRVVPFGVELSEDTPGSRSSEQSLRVVRAMAYDDGASIVLQYNGSDFPAPSETYPAGRHRSASLTGQSLPHHFEAFVDGPSEAMPPTDDAGGSPRARSDNQSRAEPSTGPQSSQPELSPEVRSDGALRTAAPDWQVLDDVAQQKLPPANEDTFVSDLQALLSEAKRRADAGQEMPALSSEPDSQASVSAPTTPSAPPQLPAPTAASPAAQEQIAGTDTSNRHALFDQLGKQMQSARTFDIGTVSVDKKFAAFEAAMDAKAAHLKATQQAHAKRPSPTAKPLAPIEEVEDMALMTAPRQTPSVAVAVTARPDSSKTAAQAPMLSSEVPLDPGVGGRSIGESALEIGDLIVSTTHEKLSGLIRYGTQAPVSHAMLYVGDGQVVEAIRDGVTLRPIEQAIADSYLAVALRHPYLTPEQGLLVRDYAGQQIGKPYNFVGIVRPARFQLAKKIFCEGKTGDAYDECIRRRRRVNLGTATNDRFYCSELVLKSYEAAGIPLTSSPPDYSTPGDIVELQLRDTLAYVGHLKFEP